MVVKQNHKRGFRDLFLTSNILMEKKEKYFAKPLSKPERFITALRVTSIAYMNKNVNIPSVMFALLYDYEKDERTGYQKNTLCNTSVSKETAYELREYFVKMYEDEDLLIDYLNERVTKNYFGKLKRTHKDKDETEALIKSIFNEGDEMGLMKNLLG